MLHGNFVVLLFPSHICFPYFLTFHFSTMDFCESTVDPPWAHPSWVHPPWVHPPWVDPPWVHPQWQFQEGLRANCLTNNVSHKAGGMPAALYVQEELREILVFHILSLLESCYAKPHPSSKKFSLEASANSCRCFATTLLPSQKLRSHNWPEVQRPEHRWTTTWLHGAPGAQDKSATL